jgi:hypothetical protein
VWDRGVMHRGFWWGNQKKGAEGKRNLENLNVDEKIILSRS